MKSQEEWLVDLGAEALRHGAEYRSIEYKAGFEEAFASTGSIAHCIARLPSSSEDAARLRGELDKVTRQKQRVAIGSTTYELHATTYDSFGETGFRVNARRV